MFYSNVYIHWNFVIEILKLSVYRYIDNCLIYFPDKVMRLGKTFDEKKNQVIKKKIKKSTGSQLVCHFRPIWF